MLQGHVRVFLPTAVAWWILRQGIGPERLKKTYDDHHAIGYIKFTANDKNLWRELHVTDLVEAVHDLWIRDIINDRQRTIMINQMKELEKFSKAYKQPACDDTSFSAYTRRWIIANKLMQKCKERKVKSLKI